MPLGCPQFKIEIEKPLNHPRFQGKEALWLPSTRMQLEKPFNPLQIKTEIKKPFSNLRFHDLFQIYQLSHRLSIHNSLFFFLFFFFQYSKTLVLCSKVLGFRAT